LETFTLSFDTASDTDETFLGVGVLDNVTPTVRRGVGVREPKSPLGVSDPALDFIPDPNLGVMPSFLVISWCAAGDIVARRFVPGESRKDDLDPAWEPIRGVVARAWDAFERWTSFSASWSLFGVGAMRKDGVPARLGPSRSRGVPTT
jgi:hypothetical protein